MKRSMKMTTIFAALTASTLIAGPVSAKSGAANYPGDVGGAERIESGDLLRVYSQEVAAAACFYFNDIEAELSVELMTEAREGFDLHLAALKNGNQTLGINGAEERRKTLVKLDEIQVAWSSLDQAVGALVENQNDTEAVTVIKDQNMGLFELTDILVSELEGQYADPFNLMLSDVLMLEIAARQALMTQKIAKNACKLLSGRDTDVVRKDLEEAVSIYEVSLNALITGMPEVGLGAAPTPEIAAGLLEVQKDWMETKPVLEAITAGTSEAGAMNYLFRHMADEMHKLEEISHQYVVHSKQN